MSEGSGTIGPAVLSGVDVHVRASAHLFHGSCKSGDIVYLCDSGICICASAAFPPPSILEGGLASQTQSFLFSDCRGSGTGENPSRRPEGGGQGSALSLGCPGELRFPPRSGAGAAARAAGEEMRGPGRAAGGGERWVASSHLAREDHYTGVGALGQSEQPRGKGGGRWFWSSVLFQPQHSCPRLSHGAPPPPSTSGLSWGCTAWDSPFSSPGGCISNKDSRMNQGIRDPPPPSPGFHCSTRACGLQMCFPDVLPRPHPIRSPSPLAFLRE